MANLQTAGIEGNKVVGQLHQSGRAIVDDSGAVKRYIDPRTAAVAGNQRRARHGRRPLLRQWPGRILCLICEQEANRWMFVHIAPRRT